jgi:hypothetical protein
MGATMQPIRGLHLAVQTLLACLHMLHNGGLLFNAFQCAERGQA